MNELWAETWQTIVENLIISLPEVLTGVLIILVGISVAWFLTGLLVSGAEEIHLDKLMGQTALKDIWPKIQGGRGEWALWAKLFFWWLMFVFMEKGFEVMGVITLATAFGVVVSFFWRVVMGLFVIGLGIKLAQLSGERAGQGLREYGFKEIDKWQEMITAIIGGIFVIMGLEVIGFRLSFLSSVIEIGLQVVFVGLGVVFVIGTRDYYRDLLAGLEVKNFYKVGDVLDLDGERGVVKSFEKFHVVLVMEDGVVLAPYHHFLTRLVKVVNRAEP
ncbi:MAG TPA: hypothetical protein VLL52_08750 [Anaerolineae bacterium]|nr:hypothetical protein [Anaerolineae bacterium]